MGHHLCQILVDVVEGTRQTQTESGAHPSES